MVESQEQIIRGPFTPDGTARVITHTSANEITAPLILRINEAVSVINHVLATLSFPNSHCPTFLDHTFDFFCNFGVNPRSTDTALFWSFFEHVFNVENVLLKIFFVILGKICPFWLLFLDFLLRIWQIWGSRSGNPGAGSVDLFLHFELLQLEL